MDKLNSVLPVASVHNRHLPASSRYVTILGVLLGSALFFSSCKTSKKIVESAPVPVKVKGDDAVAVFDSVAAHAFRCEWLVAKAQVDYTDKRGETNSFDVNMRLRKDSLLWISITPLLGIEAVRVLINPDSIVMLDRVHKEVSIRKYDYLEEMLHAPVSFAMIQAVIAGNYFPYRSNEKIRSLYEEEPYFILSTMNKRQARRTMEEKDPSSPVVQDFWIDGNYRIAKAKITDDKLDRWVEARYTAFDSIGPGLFPQQLVVTISGSTPVIMKITYEKLTTDEPAAMPFSVPEKYERK